MKLRNWQKECSEKAVERFCSGQRDFLCLATPGAGKTVMAAEVGRQLLSLNMIDYVICLSPSRNVSEGIKATFEKHTGFRFDGLIGSKGGSFTYQSKKVAKGYIKRLLSNFRVLVIFDEIHHCSGNGIEKSNSWGRDIIEFVSEHASYLLSMTGTPWRSDNTPITLARYNRDTGEVICDYKYGLAQAIKDGVCRSPMVVATDNDNITLDTGAGKLEAFNGFSDLLSNSLCSYQDIVENDIVIHHMLNIANARLTQIRQENPNAAGLVVTSNVSHARKIHRVLREDLGIASEIATYEEENPAELINCFRSSRSPWIVSVGMISEGTDIPRLQVCCHLTRIKTELYFRQVLGRILRITDTKNQDAVLYMPAETKLIDYAQRLQEDVPKALPILDIQFSNGPVALEVGSATLGTLSNDTTDSGSPYLLGVLESDGVATELANKSRKSPRNDEFELGIYGQFYEEVVNSFSFKFSR